MIQFAHLPENLLAEAPASGCSIGLSFKGNGRHGDDRAVGKPPFQIVIFRLAFSEACRQR
jgi:hypothetical protein